MSRADALRRIPAVDKVLESDEVKAATTGLPREAVAAAVRRLLDEARQNLIEGGASPEGGSLAPEALAPRVARAARELLSPTLRRVINATGVVIHTNLGRAPLAEAAAKAASEAARGYANLEYDLKTGGRGGRARAVEDLLEDLSGAEAALVVNNNAAAVVLTLAAISAGREAVISRGELVEIGGSFRIPDIMAAAGAVMVEVGTTNKTKIDDYEQAIGPQTALLMKVHTSNYEVVGFTASVPLAGLVGLGRDRGIPVVEDLGSGNLLDEKIGEPPVAASLTAGADIVTFSGDKLLGGPQAGLILGSAAAIAPLRRHPLYRAFRLDKISLAALEATLRIYKSGDPFRDIPVLAAAFGGCEPVLKRAEKLALRLASVAGVSAEPVATKGRVGGGALPLLELESRAVAVSVRGMDPANLAEALRASSPPVIGRIEGGALIVDLIAVADEEIDEIVRAVAAAAE